MTGEGELYRKILWELKEASVKGRYPKIQEVLDEAKQDMPKHYVYTDYTHDFGIDPVEQPEEFAKIKAEDYPKYVHIPSDKDWLKWAKKWFGDVDK